MKFEELNLDPSIMDGIMGLGFENTTPVQEQAIPIILEGKDLIACAQTGTGKTAAFLIPVMEKLLQKEGQKTRVVIIVPTRELAGQIDQNVEAIGYFAGISSAAVYGGKNTGDWDRQKRAITGGADILIATPGRFKTHHSLGYMDLKDVDTVILDEADKMLDMGFFGDILEIISYLPEERQTLMFSATMPKNIRKLAKEILTDPEEITLALSKPAEGVKQSAFMVYEEQKIKLLGHLFKEKEVESMIIFASSKASVDKITRKLQKLDIDARAIHSDRSQEERNSTLNDFKNKQFPIVVATDVLSRGIDIDNLSHVLNFDVPLDAEDYVHRVGRTARASSTGEALTFICPDDAYRFRKIEDLIEREVPKEAVPEELGQTPSYNPSRRGGGGHRGRRQNGSGRSGGRRGGGGGNRNRNRRSGGGGRGNPQGRGQRREGEERRSRSGEGSRSDRPNRNRNRKRNRSGGGNRPPQGESK